MASSSDAPGGARRRTPIFGAFLEGWRRVWRAPAVAAGVLLTTMLLALPLGMVMKDAIESHLGSSLQADRAAEGWNAGWAAEFGAQAQGVARTFTQEFLGFGGTLSILSDLADREPMNTAIAWAVVASIVVWMFLWGGIMDRLARGRPVRAAHFFAACGVYFLRFLRLGLIVGAVYWALFAWLHPWLFDDVYHRLTRDMTLERDGIVVRALLYFFFFLIIAIVNVIADFAKVRAVVEDRRSMLGAIGASLRFIRRRVFRVLGLYLLNGIAFLVILRLWLQVAPSADASVWFALLVSEIYLLARVWARLSFAASEIVFFQGELAHAQYTALPDPVWPDSPSVEAIDNLSRNYTDGV